MVDYRAAQATQLVRALGEQLHKIANQSARLERLGVGTSRRASEFRLEAAALRRDIQDARNHIDRLQRRYLTSVEIGPPTSENRLGESVVDAHSSAYSRVNGSFRAGLREGKV